ncbi:MAG TPA: hypothetical protein VJ937_05620 [Salinivirga sp.]|uniref:hypothetical protein n=1 Tax=Salinivirga sp. TaxID=1970192 RepID=UPI002B4689AA|nr:hypothetical protein [Salinivirga sp.]HKK58934.1 hypothetical protein [Salinivirga sp.]
MTLQEAYNFFESLKIETTKKSEIRIYEKFLHILSELKNRDFTTDEIQSIETELDSLSLKSNPENRKKYFGKALHKLNEYLKSTFSLIPGGYYITYGIAIGVAFGPVLGVLFGQFFEKSLGISIGISIGIVVGLLAGQYLDSQAKAAGNVL